MLWSYSEWATGGTLRDLIIKTKVMNRVFSEYDVLDYFTRLVLGLEEVHY